MWIYANPNPCRTETEDCVVRAIAIVTGKTWRRVHHDLCELSVERCTMPSVNWLWGEYLRKNGFEQKVLPKTCPACVSVRDFCRSHPDGAYILCTGQHAVAAINGNYYDTSDSGDEILSWYWKAR